MKGKGNLFGLIRNYRSIAKNVEFQDILNEIDSDLHYVTEKSKKDVLLFMQHLVYKIPSWNNCNGSRPRMCLGGFHVYICYFYVVSMLENKCV